MVALTLEAFLQQRETKPASELAVDEIFARR